RGAAAEAERDPRREGAGDAAHRPGRPRAFQGGRARLAGPYQRRPAQGGREVARGKCATGIKKPGESRAFRCELRTGRSAAHHAAHHAADHAAHEGAGVGTATATATAAAAPTTALIVTSATASTAAAARWRAGRIVGGLRGRHDLGEQRLVL